jgi:serine/threonine protein kinase
MGTVWLAEDSLLKRQVAVKEIDFPPGFDAEERDGLEARLLREARAAARLTHHGAVSVYDVVEHGDRPWIVMEYVDAPTLDEKIKSDGPLTPPEAARLGIELLDVLEAAHAEGIVHRDVKPGNVMCPSDGHAKLADFGIASIQDDPKITQTGLVLGSPSFMAPEQAAHGTSGPEADLWSLGATLYQAVEGQPPFDRGAPLPTLTAVMGEDPRPMMRAGGIAPAITALLQKDPAARPSAGEASTMLQEVLAPNDISPAPTIAPTTTTDVSIDDARTRSPWWPWALLMLGIIAIIAVVVLLNGNETPSRSADRGRDAAGKAATSDDEASGATIPADWTSYTDEASGYTLHYPQEWDIITRDASALDFTDPDTGTYLRVAWTDDSGDDVMARLEDIEAAFDADHAGYAQIQMTETDYRGNPAGLWEYTYEDGGAALHAYNLQFVIGDSYGFALNLQTHEEDWADSQELWDSLQATFEPPS